MIIDYELKYLCIMLHYKNQVIRIIYKYINDIKNFKCKLIYWTD